MIFLLLAGFFSDNLSAQPNYWQQELDYQIEVTLDDVNHKLNGYLLLDYVNHSPDTLNFIYFHFWPNAFKHTETAFAQQKRVQGSLKFHYVLPSEIGYIDQMDFKVDGKDAFLTLEEDNPDIGKLLLNEPLMPGASIRIETPFQVKIPNSFSRLGHVGQSYQITQWYPKPAVYDHKGWHPMPYLDQGEFYSEFGSFDVKVSLPKNYVVGATGDLQNKTEIDFLNRLAEKTAKIDSFGTDLTIPESDEAFKTLHYKQSNIHDFAWFADKRFHVLKETFVLPENGEELTAWAMFTNEQGEFWTKGAQYVKEALLFYSEKLGAYPYKQATTVQSALSAGAGMEYPNVTVIGYSDTELALENVIVHEVGHNWFYGQLANNERVHPWMDEGMNTYYEQRYFREKYPESNLAESELDSEGLLKLIGLNGLNNRDLFEKVIQVPARLNLDQPIEEESQNYTSSNYGLSTYVKAGLAMSYLEHYLGKKKMDAIMQDYYRSYEFKHVYPEDFKAIIEQNTGRPIDWFFDEMLPTTKRVDYWLYKFAPQAKVIGRDTFDRVLIRNHPEENVAGPYPITALKEGKAIRTIWYDGFHGQEQVLFPSLDYDELVIDYYHHLPEYDRLNNRLGSPKYKVALFPKIENNEKRQLFGTPFIGYNAYDKFMAGLAFYNSIGPLRDFQFTVAPMYSFGSKDLTGTAQFKYTKHFGNRLFSKADIELKARRFAYDFVTDPETLEQNNLLFLRLAPELKVYLRQTPTSTKEAFMSYRFIWLEGEKLGEFAQKPNSYFSRDAIHELSFEYRDDQVLKPHSFKLRLIEGYDYANRDVYGYIDGEAKMKLNYSADRRSIDFRLFGGAFIANKLLGVNGNVSNPKTIGMIGKGEYDFTYEDFWLERNAGSAPGLLGKQIYERGGGFKLLDFRGESQKWLTAFNLEVDIPFIPKIDPLFNLRFFADIGISADERAFPFYRFERRFTFQDDFLTDGGLALSMFGGAFKVYWTIWYSDVFDRARERSFADKISFYVDMPQLNPIRAIRKINERL